MNYTWEGVLRASIRVRGYLKRGFYVRRVTRNGYISGFLTDRGGWGKPELGQCFDDAQSACEAARKVGCRSFDVVENVLGKP